MDNPSVKFFSNHKFLVTSLIFISLILLMLLSARMYLLTSYNKNITCKVVDKQCYYKHQ